MSSDAYVYKPDYRDYLHDDFDYGSINEFVFIVQDDHALNRAVNICGIDGKYLGMVNKNNLYKIT